MKNAIIILNLVGVLGLGVLCIAQWRMDRQLRTEINRFEAIRADQAAKLGEKDKAIAGHVSDLGTLREHLARLTGAVKEAEGKWRASEQEAAQLATERDQLLAAVKKWSETVEARDAQMRSANLQIQELAARCNDTVLKFNELATNYNESVELLNERTAAYNELVNKFNEQARK